MKELIESQSAMPLLTITLRVSVLIESCVRMSRTLLGRLALILLGSQRVFSYCAYPPHHPLLPLLRELGLFFLVRTLGLLLLPKLPFRTFQLAMLVLC